MARKDRKKSRREMYGKHTQQSVKQSHERNILGGGGLFKDNIEGAKYWKQKEGNNLIDIIPFFAGAFASDLDKDVSEGQDIYKVQVYAHGRIGINENWMFCRLKNLKKKCPICEHRQKLQREVSIDEELIKSLTLSQFPRVIYNVVSDNSRDDAEKGVQIWHTSTWNMERHLADQAKNPRIHGGGYEAYTDFSHPDQGIGKSIAFTSSGSRGTLAFIGHKFVDRDYDISDELLESAFILDECIFIPNYDEACLLYWGEEGEEEVVARGRGRGVEGEIKDDDAEDEIKDEQEETEQKSITRERKRKKKEEPEEVEEDEGCPHGGNFGIDIDELDACEDCDEEKWKECA
ncbi:hypothetical protein LCGC14_1599140, partial [marine sediment metagenome]